MVLHYYSTTNTFIHTHTYTHMYMCIETLTKRTYTKLLVVASKC